MSFIDDLTRNKEFKNKVIASRIESQKEKSETYSESVKVGTFMGGDMYCCVRFDHREEEIKVLTDKNNKMGALLVDTIKHINLLSDEGKNLLNKIMKII